MRYHNGGQQLKREHYFPKIIIRKICSPQNILRCTIIARMTVTLLYSAKFSRAANLQKK